ncbi:nucleoside triphosphate pyrophosphohydrolase [Bacillus sp. 03113]|uniref:nucleoside triphosphate pyrophosphohydrolase n=1 Tax=Bacillus sp. 03113 TaxID=2578211 RepID=UPI0037C18891
MKITILGLGAGDLNQLPLGVYKALVNGSNIYLRTKEHPVVRQLEQEGLSFQSFDSVYEQFDQFEDVYKTITESLLKNAGQENIIYAVPGHPLVAEKTVQLLLEAGPENGIEIEVKGGQSFLDSLFQALKIDPIDGFQLLDGTALRREEIQLRQHVIIGQVYDSYVASDVKLTLMEKLPYDYQIFIVIAAGSAEEQIKKVPLVELDREVELNNLTTIYIPPVQEEEILYKEFTKLRQIIAELRGPNGCPWDLKQTHQSLKKYLIEEAYEYIEAINEEDIDHMIEELGDVLLQVLLHAQIGEDDGFFSIEDVIQGISSKMIRRHPHVFGNSIAKNEEDVMKKWQEIKKEEKGEKSFSLLDGIGKEYPNLMRAYDIQKKCAEVGFDWPEVEQAWEKVKEECIEFQEEVKKDAKSEEAVKEFGDILFALVNVARFYKINPELALFETNEKFKNRFSYIEGRVKESGKEFHDFTLKELDRYWDEAKEKGL